MIYENVFNTIQFFNDLISFDNKQCRSFTSYDKICSNFSFVKHVIDHMNAIEIMTMTMTLKLLFSHLFWMRFSKKKIISNFIFEFIEHKCDESEKHLISLNLMCEKLQRTIFSAICFRFHSFLQRWKTFDELHNLIYFDFYHMLRCKSRINVKIKIFLKFKSIFLFENRVFSLMKSFELLKILSSSSILDFFQIFMFSQFHDYINFISISITFTTLKCVYLIS